MSAVEPPNLPKDPPVLVPMPPPAGRKFPCSQCGAKLDFDPASQALQCPYCGHIERIAPAEQPVENLDYAAYLHRQAGEQRPLPGHSSQVRCGGCGAVVILDDKIQTDQCPFCGTHLENKPQAAESMIQPEGVLPFTVSMREAQAAFNAWVVSRWFAPSEFRQLANLGRLNGLYLPFWTYDSMTYTHYTGQRGDDYTATETYTETDSNGQQVTKTRTVTRTNWYPVSGNIQHFFQDVLVGGTRSLQDYEVNGLMPWDLGHLQGFKAEFLSGFQTERYAVGLEEGFTKARGIMDGYIREMCRRDIGGDHQVIHTVQTQHVGVTFKHVLLPVWLGVYRYRDQPYRVIVNARSGRVYGCRPYSWVKIGLLIAALIALAVLIWALISNSGSVQGDWRGEAPPPVVVAQVVHRIPGRAMMEAAP